MPWSVLLYILSNLPLYEEIRRFSLFKGYQRSTDDFTITWILKNLLYFIPVRCSKLPSYDSVKKKDSVVWVPYENSYIFQDSITREISGEHSCSYQSSSWFFGMVHTTMRTSQWAQSLVGWRGAKRQEKLDWIKKETEQRCFWLLKKGGAHFSQFFLIVQFLEILADSHHNLFLFFLPRITYSMKSVVL